MYIINVIPLIKIPRPNPQILSYFFKEKIKRGALVKISLRKKLIRAVVVEAKKIENEKIWIKKFANFKIKPIEKIISSVPVLDEKQIKLLFWISDYYFVSLGVVAKIFISRKFTLSDKKFNKPTLIIGPKNKSLIFGPFKRLKKIIVEDESSNLYWSWGRKPYYNVRDIIPTLAKIHGAKLILKAEIPSVESYYWSKKKKFILRINNPQNHIPSPSKNIVDMREELKNGNNSIICRSLQRALKDSDKSILYIARRGTATFILCRECGFVATCKDCSVPLVYHEDKPAKKLICHHCGNEDIAPVLCPNCKSIKIKYFGAGTQKVESEIKKFFPDKKIFRLDSDTAPKSSDQQKVLNEFSNAQNAVLVGSQMLVGKNLNADLTAIVSLETILNLPDYKNSERVFQIINKIIKMANKEFWIQSYNPESSIFRNALENNFTEFYNNEIKNRESFNYPPFCQLIKLKFRHKNSEKAKSEARIIFEKLNTQKEHLKIEKKKLEIIGPIPSFIHKEKGLYCWNIIIKSKIKDLATRNKLLTIIPPNIEIIIDPITIL